MNNNLYICILITIIMLNLVIFDEIVLREGNVNKQNKKSNDEYSESSSNESKKSKVGRVIKLHANKINDGFKS